MSSTHPTAKMPKELRHHLDTYFPDSWRGYTLQELGSFVHLLTVRSLQRGNPMKRANDLYDARNYWHMIGAHLDAHELDAESHSFEFGAGATPAPATLPEWDGEDRKDEEALVVTEEDIKEALAVIMDPAGDMEQQTVPTSNADLMGDAEVPAGPTPPGDMEQQEPPVGDVDLMGEIDGMRSEHLSGVHDLAVGDAGVPGPTPPSLEAETPTKGRERKRNAHKPK